MASNAPRESQPEPAARQSWPRWLIWLQNLIGAAIVVAFLFYLWRRRSHLAAVLDVSALDLVLLTLLVLLSLLLAAAQAYVMYRAAGVGIGFRENGVLAFATYFGNYLPMRVGTLVRARYLKAVHGLRYARFGSISGIRVVLVVIATGLCGLVGTVGVALSGGRLSLELLAVFGALAVLPCAALLWRPPPRREGAGRIQRIWYDFSDGFVQLRRQPRASWQVLALILLQYLTLAVRFLIAARATGTDASPLLLVLLAPLAALGSFTALTPGGLGIREAVMGYATYATGASFFQGVYVGALDRAVLLGIVAVFGGACFIRVWPRIRGTPGGE